MTTLLIDRPHPKARFYEDDGLLDDVPDSVLCGVLPTGIPRQLVLRVLDGMGISHDHARFIRRPGPGPRPAATADESLTAGEALELGHAVFSVRDVPPALVAPLADRLRGIGAAPVRYFGAGAGSTLTSRRATPACCRREAR